MHVDRAPDFRQRLADWLSHLEHLLPAQAPIRDFVHHNTLHGLQHLPFVEALRAAQAATGARTYWDEANFRAAHAAGRISRDDLLAALAEAGPPDGDIAGADGLRRREVWLASLLSAPAAYGDPDFAALPRLTAAGDWRQQANARWQALCGAPGYCASWRRLLQHLSGEDVLAGVHTALKRHLAAHLDLGLAVWRNPARAGGFYAAWKASAGLDLAWELDELPGIHADIRQLPDDPLLALEQSLRALLPDENRWLAWLTALALELPGWAGMMRWRERHPASGDVPVALVDYLAVRAFLEHGLCREATRRLTGAPLDFAEFLDYYRACPGEFLVRHALAVGGLDEATGAAVAGLCAAAAGREASGWDALAPQVLASLQAAEAQHDAQYLAALLDTLAQLGRPLSPDVRLAGELRQTAAALDAGRRGEIWLLAYEAHYREQILSALASNLKRHAGRPATRSPPSAQVVFCMDDREEGTRRHLEEIAPTVETFGAAGFFGIAMRWRGIDDATATALCPVVVTPQHQIDERPCDAARWQVHAGRRERRLRWRERLYQQTRHAPLAGPLLTALAGAPALAALTAGSLAPAWLARASARWRRLYEGEVPAEPQVCATAPAVDGIQHGFSDIEQVDRVEAFLRTIGLTDGFAPLVLMLGHGSHSRNNPHASAYECGACSGRHGGPNARVFAWLANRPAVRAGLRARGIAIPDGTRFIAAGHDTCDDTVDWYDLPDLPAPWQAAVDQLVGQLGEACRAHAVERCRRLASAPLRPGPWQARRHVAGRAADPAQARPELGHATNAAAFIGRRALSRGLFLDRRVFLISYDPLPDDDGRIVESILLAAGPVGAGIALEYYFSTVDNERFGCGSKVTHNLTGLFGVMDGADSDLRTGLPWQMVEIHEPMRLLVVVEQAPALLSAIVARQPALQELVGNAWIQLAAVDPVSGEIFRHCPRRGWLPWQGAQALPRVARSADWFAGERGALAPALLLGGER